MPREVESTAGTEREQDTPNWAARLAHRQQRVPEPPKEPADSLLGDATEALWLPFDAAVREANAALEQAGEPGRISITRTIRERQYGAEGPDGSQRQIAVYLVLSVVEDRLTGGAYVSTNQSRLSMYLVPEKTATDVHWIVASSGLPFNIDMVHDLFLSVFADDPAATHRLSPLSGSDLFQTPWA